MLFWTSELFVLSYCQKHVFCALSQHADMEPIILDEHVISGIFHQFQSKDFVIFFSLKKNSALDFVFLPRRLKAGRSSMILD